MHIFQSRVCSGCGCAGFSGRLMPAPQQQQQRGGSQCFNRRQSGSAGRCAVVTAISSSQQSDFGGAPLHAVDPFKAAGNRLQSLLSGTGSGEEELIKQQMADAPADAKLACSFIAAALTGSTALFVCWLSGVDPCGGTALSMHSLRAMLIGTAAAVVPITFRLLLWDEDVRRSEPAFQLVWEWQIEHTRPMLDKLTAAQMSMLLCADNISLNMMVMPAAQGGLTAAFSTYVTYLRSIGLPMPAQASSGLALVLVSFLVGAWVVTQVCPAEEEVAAVKEAMANSDRYYQVLGKDAAPEPQRSAEAFKAVAQSWLTNRIKAVNVAGSLTFWDTVYLGTMWRLTGDLAAPMACSLITGAVEYLMVQRASPRRDPPPSQV